jgi:hypothetical protein
LHASGCDEVVDIAFLESKNPTDLVDLDKSRDHLRFGFSVRVMLFLGVDLHFGFGNGALSLPIGSDKKAVRHERGTADGGVKLDAGDFDVKPSG